MRRGRRRALCRARRSRRGCGRCAARLSLLLLVGDLENMAVGVTGGEMHGSDDRPGADTETETERTRAGHRLICTSTAGWSEPMLTGRALDTSKRPGTSSPRTPTPR